MTDLRTAAQQVLEALELIVQWDEADLILLDHHIERARAAIAAMRAVLTEPQEPVAYSVGRTLHWHEGKGVNDAQLYLAPPQRKPLTDEEIYGMYSEPRSDAELEEFAREIERAHGIGGE